MTAARLRIVAVAGWTKTYDGWPQHSDCSTSLSSTFSRYVITLWCGPLVSFLASVSAQKVDQFASKDARRCAKRDMMRHAAPPTRQPRPQCMKPSMHVSQRLLRPTAT